MQSVAVGGEARAAAGAADVGSARSSAIGHRQRLKERLLAGDADARTDAALLELLLSYAIPQKDVQPLAAKLLSAFGGLKGVLAADPQDLCAQEGVGAHTAVLLKLVDQIRATLAASEAETRLVDPKQVTFFHLVDVDEDSSRASDEGSLPVVAGAPPPCDRERFAGEARPPAAAQALARRGEVLFGKAVLREAIELLPRLPDTESLDEVRAFVRSSLPFSAVETRQRYASYIVQRMFPSGTADRALRRFATRYADRQELRDVCFYRFCAVEPLMRRVVEDLLLPSIGGGRLGRDRLRGYLAQRFPDSRGVHDTSHAVVAALVAAGVARADRAHLSFAYREILLPSFAFVLHSEFPEPGMYDIARLESNQAIRAMLWDPARILPALYELRDLGIISKVSQIDSVRQFTTRWALGEAVDALVGGGGPA
ncbi:MAG: DNA repair protein [Chloroflexi bacterium]|nr:DNA repair protein [Chloroflexota bacterium]